MKKELTCIVCPLGCSLTAEMEHGKVLSVVGNTCPKGAKYAQTECVSPQRTVTSTVRCTNGAMLPVKTDREIPKEKIMECMKIINNCIAHLPISVGDVIIKDVFGSNIVATANMK